MARLGRPLCQAPIVSLATGTTLVRGPRSLANGHANGNGNGNGNGHKSNGHAPRSEAVADLFYEVRWVERAAASPPAVAMRSPGLWRIFETREASAGPCERASKPGASGPSGPMIGIWRRSGIKALSPASSPTRSSRFRSEVLSTFAPSIRSAATRAKSCRRTLDLARSVARFGGAKLWIATAGAQAIGDEPTDPDLATLWGLARSIAVEIPATWGGMIDLDPARPSGDSEALADFLLASDPEDQSAFRRGRMFVPRMLRFAPVEPRKPVGLRPDGTYVVTGGLGDLGLRSARWLVDRGARRVVLLGRRGLPPRPSWDDLPDGHPLGSIVEAIRGMERLGATVVVAAVDVADERRMAALFERLATLLPPIRGIVHARRGGRLGRLRGRFPAQGRRDDGPSPAGERVPARLPGRLLLPGLDPGREGRGLLGGEPVSRRLCPLGRLGRGSRDDDRLGTLGRRRDGGGAIPGASPARPGTPRSRRGVRGAGPADRLGDQARDRRRLRLVHLPDGLRPTRGQPAPGGDRGPPEGGDRLLDSPADRPLADLFARGSPRGPDPLLPRPGRRGPSPRTRPGRDRPGRSVLWVWIRSWRSSSRAVSRPTSGPRSP